MYPKATVERPGSLQTSHAMLRAAEMRTQETLDLIFFLLFELSKIEGFFFGGGSTVESAQKGPPILDGLHREGSKIGQWKCQKKKRKKKS